MKLYNETDNKHPRGFVGMLYANDLLKAGWTEIQWGLDSHFWVSPEGENIGSLEFAWKTAFEKE